MQRVPKLFSYLQNIVDKSGKMGQFVLSGSQNFHLMNSINTGLLTYLLTIKNTDELQINRIKGNFFENMVIAEFEKQNNHLYLHNDYYFWQDSNGHEIDLLPKNHNGFEIFKVKSTQTISTDLFK